MLTNEILNKRFDNPFVLVNYAISLAKIKIQRGEGVDSNPVIEVLESIAKNRDHLEQEDSEEEDEDDRFADDENK